MTNPFKSQNTLVFGCLAQFVQKFFCQPLSLAKKQQKNGNEFPFFNISFLKKPFFADINSALKPAAIKQPITVFCRNACQLSMRLLR